MVTKGKVITKVSKRVWCIGISLISRLGGGSLVTMKSYQTFSAWCLLRPSNLLLTVSIYKRHNNWLRTTLTASLKFLKCFHQLRNFIWLQPTWKCFGYYTSWTGSWSIKNIRVNYLQARHLVRSKRILVGWKLTRRVFFTSKRNCSMENATTVWSTWTRVNTRSFSRKTRKIRHQCQLFTNRFTHWWWKNSTMLLMISTKFKKNNSINSSATEKKWLNPKKEFCTAWSLIIKLEATWITSKGSQTVSFKTKSSLRICLDLY